MEMKYYTSIRHLMHIFYTEFVGQHLQIPPGEDWTKEDLRNISESVQTRIEALSMQNKDNRATVYVAGKLLVIPTYKKVEADAWLGIRALKHIEYFVKGGEIKRFSSRTLDVVATIMGYREGFFGYRQGKRLEPQLLEKADLG
jgi:hypothetical protein